MYTFVKSYCRPLKLKKKKKKTIMTIPIEKENKYTKS